MINIRSPGINQLVIDFYLFNLSYWGKARKQNNNFANMWKLFGSRQSQGMPLKLTRASLGHWAREKTEGPKVYENFLLTRCVFMILSGTYIWPTLTTIKLSKCAKGGLISESFSLWLKSLNTKVPNNCPLVDCARNSGLTTFFWDLCQS